jgi:hypothetical protein
VSALAPTGVASAAAVPSGSVPFLGSADDDAAVRAMAAAVARPGVTTTPVPTTEGCVVTGASLLGAMTWRGMAALLYLSGDGRVIVMSRGDCRTLDVVAAG